MYLFIAHPGRSQRVHASLVSRHATLLVGHIPYADIVRAGIDVQKDGIFMNRSRANSSLHQQQV